MNYTKGNWIFSEYSGGDYGVHSDSGDGRDIALVRAKADSEETKANCNLIAAAPMLYSFMKEAVDHAHVYDTNPVLVELFEAALRKAEGKA